MKQDIRVILLLILLLVYGSCTYQRPLLSIKVSTKVVADSITHETRKQNNYTYWGLKKLTRIGGYSKTIKFDSVGNKVSIKHWKKKPLYVHDGNVRSYSKIIYYNNSGKKEKVTKYIFQKLGVGGYTALDTTIYFENGKRIKSVNQ